MPTTRTQARDDVAALIKAVTDTVSGFVTIYDDTRQEIPKQDADPLPSWARVLIRHVASPQVSLSNVTNKRIYETSGLVTVQLFTPGHDGLTASDSLSTQLVSAFRGVSTSNGVWFKNVRSAEIGSSGPWFQVNVLAEFEYDEIE